QRFVVAHQLPLGLALRRITERIKRGAAQELRLRQQSKHREHPWSEAHFARLARNLFAPGAEPPPRGGKEKPNGRPRPPPPPPPKPKEQRGGPRTALPLASTQATGSPFGRRSFLAGSRELLLRRTRRSADVGKLNSRSPVAARSRAPPPGPKG